MFQRLSITLMLLGSICILTMEAPQALAADKSKDETLSIKVRDTKLRSQPLFWAPAVATLKYGDSVVPLSAEAGWIKARFSGKSGFIHEGALSTQKIVLSSKSSNLPSSPQSSEVVLAGKGFNKQVEDEYAKQVGATNFAAVNAMERITVSDSELKAFMKQGQLGGL